MINTEIKYLLKFYVYVSDGIAQLRKYENMLYSDLASNQKQNGFAR